MTEDFDRWYRGYLPGSADVLALIARFQDACAEIERLKTKLWTHGDTCSSECTEACTETHTYEIGCWYGAFDGEPLDAYEWGVLQRALDRIEES